MKNLSTEKYNKVQLKYMKIFAKEKSLPEVVGQPERFNEKELGAENNYHKTFLKHLGFKGFEIKGGFYRFLRMPKGWKKVVAKQSNQWCYLIDDKKRSRAVVFYKVLAVSNRGGVQVNTFVNYMTRYLIRTATFKGEISSSVFDTSNVLYTSAKFPEPKDKKDRNEIVNKCYLECELWLKDKYPEWANINAYWE